MDLDNVFVPVEILVEIVRHLRKKDIKSIRLTSKCLTHVATRFLFESLYISSQLKDREAFTAVSEDRNLSHLVKEVVYDSTNISFLEGQEHFRLNKTSYTRFLTGCQSSPRAVEFSKAALRRGFMSFAKRCEEHQALAEYDGEELTHWNWDLRPPDQPDRNFSSMLMDPKSLSTVMQYLPDDLVRLLKGIPRMPKLRRFVISDCRYSENTKHRVHSCWDYEGGDIIRELSVTVKNKGVRGADEVILDPRPWPSRLEEWPPGDCNRTWYRGFCVLMQAASMLNMTTLDSFTVERDCGMSGLSHVMFAMSPQRLRHTMNAFSSLKIIHLKIHTAHLRREQWRDTIAGGALAQVLGAAKHLEDLDLRLDDFASEMDFVIPFAKLVGTHRWLNLRSASFAHIAMNLDENGFLQFFDRHSQTLQVLRLSKVVILSKGWASGKGHEQIYLSWVETFRSMAAGQLELKDFSFRNVYPSLANNLRPFHSCDTATIRKFLHSGGRETTTAPCRHYFPEYLDEDD